MNRPPTMKRWINRGRAVLETKPEPRRRSEKTVVRIYYVSAGDELLCTDSAAMTLQAAEKLEASLAPQNSMAVRVESYGIGEPRTAWKKARLVIMPAQMPADVELEQAA